MWTKPLPFTQLWFLHTKDPAMLKAATLDCEQIQEGILFYQNSGRSGAPPDVTDCESSMPGYAWLLSTGCIGVPGSCKWSLSYNIFTLRCSAVLLSFPSKQNSYFSSVCGFGGGTSSEIPVLFLSEEMSLDFDSYCCWKILVPVRLVRSPGSEKTWSVISHLCLTQILGDITPTNIILGP